MNKSQSEPMMELVDEFERSIHTCLAVHSPKTCKRYNDTKAKLQLIADRQDKLVEVAKDMLANYDVDNLTTQSNYRNWKKVIAECEGKDG